MKNFLQHFLLISTIKEADYIHKIKNNGIFFLFLTDISSEYADHVSVVVISRRGTVY